MLTKVQKRIYASRLHIRVFDLSAAGDLSNGRLFAETVGEGLGSPDGLKIDSRGHVFCASQGGIHVFGAEFSDELRFYSESSKLETCRRGRDR